MNYVGDFKASSTVRFKFTTHAASGASVAPSNAFEAADLIVYKDGSATQRTSASGITMTSPFDSIVGLHHVDIDLSDNTDAGFWAAGHEYSVVLSPDTETVDSLTVVAEVCTFSIENRCVNWAQVASPTTTVGLSGTTVKTATDVETDTADIQTRIPAALTVDGNIKADALRLGGTLQTGRDIGASVLLSSGTGTGQVLLSSGKVVTPDDQKVDLNTVKTQAVVCAAGVTFGVYVGNATAPIAVDGSGHVTAGTVSDKTGYSLTQTFPTNFADLAITATTGRVTVGTNADKTGYSITGTATTLDALYVSLYSARADFGLTAAQVNAEADTALADVGVTLARMGALTDWIDGGRLDLLLDAVQSDTNDIQTRIPAALVSGRMDVSVGAMATGVITDAAFTAPAEASGRPTTVLAWIRRIWERTANKRTRDRSTGTVLLRNAADDGTLETQTQSTSGTTDTETKGT